MLTLIELLATVKELASSDAEDRLVQINKLFSNPRAPAEYQVARHYVASLLAPRVEERMGSLDPSHRREAIQCAYLVFPRRAAGRVLRRAYRDPDMGVRASARVNASTLGFTDKQPHSMWSFGAFATKPAPKKGKKAPTRPTAVAANALPALANGAAVAKLLATTQAALAPLMRAGTGPGSGYVEFEIAKAKGGTRRIAAPRKPLRAVQRAILDQILSKIPTHEACHGFVKGRSTVTNATPHEGAALVVKLDLKDFFPTVHYRRVKGLFQQLGYNAEVAGLLAGLTTYRPRIGDTTVWPGILPQGAPTSPAIANLTCRRLDARLANLAKKFQATYTRYADDLTFSFATQPEIRIGRFLWFVDAICEQEGFIERPDKRRILRGKHQQRVTGIVVNHGVHVPRLDRKRFRAILHNCKKHGVASQAKDNPNFEAYLAGYAAYVHMVEPALGSRWIADVRSLLGG